MPKFEPQYTEKDFLEALKYGLKTTGYVTKKVGCARKTAETYLKKLENEGKIQKVEIDDGASHVWKLIKE